MKAPPSPTPSPKLFQHLNTSWACGCIRLRFISSTVPKQTTDKERHTSHSIGLKPLQQQRLTGGVTSLNPQRLSKVPLLTPPKAKNRPMMLCFFQKMAKRIYCSSNKSKAELSPDLSALLPWDGVPHPTTAAFFYCLTEPGIWMNAVGSNKHSLKWDLSCTYNASKCLNTSRSGILFYFPVW